MCAACLCGDKIRTKRAAAPICSRETGRHTARLKSGNRQQTKLRNPMCSRAENSLLCENRLSRAVHTSLSTASRSRHPQFPYSLPFQTQPATWEKRTQGICLGNGFPSRDNQSRIRYPLFGIPVCGGGNIHSPLFQNVTHLLGNTRTRSCVVHADVDFAERNRPGIFCRARHRILHRLRRRKTAVKRKRKNPGEKQHIQCQQNSHHGTDRTEYHGLALLQTGFILRAGFGNFIHTFNVSQVGGNR